LTNANEQQRRQLLSTIGNATATETEVAQTTALLRDLGGIDYTQQLATRMVEDGLNQLSKIAPSQYRDLLSNWAEYLIDRQR
jgi:geranylgeranyl pyrophosphate synthase